MSARKYDDLTVPRDNLAAIEVVEFLNRVAVRSAKAATKAGLTVQRLGVGKLLRRDQRLDFSRSRRARLLNGFPMHRERSSSDPLRVIPHVIPSVRGT
jgi:hypothetical protein